MTGSDTKDRILNDSIYMKCPEEENPQRQKVDHWFQGPREEEWWLANGCLFVMMKTVPKLYNGGG